MRANFDRLVQGASDAGAALAPGAAGPLLSIAISCVGRRCELHNQTMTLTTLSER